MTSRARAAAAAQAEADAAAAAALVCDSTGAPREPTLDEVCSNMLHAAAVASAVPSQRALLKYEAKIRDAMRFFERPAGGGACCDVRDVGALVRALDLNPTEATVLRIVEDAEEPVSTGLIKFERLRPLLLHALVNREYAGQVLERESERTLRLAFAALDRHGTGRVPVDTFVQLLTTSGSEPLSQEEARRLLDAVVDPLTNTVIIDDYITLLLES